MQTMTQTGRWARIGGMLADAGYFAGASLAAFGGALGGEWVLGAVFG